MCFVSFTLKVGTSSNFSNSMLETLRVLRKWWSTFSVLKTLRQWWCLFSGLKTLRVIRKQRSPFFSIKNFKSGKAVVEFPLSFKNFKSCQKVTVRVLFQWSRFIKVSYDDQISRNNIFSVSLNFFDYNILISMKKVVEHISVNTLRASFLLHE